MVRNLIFSNNKNKKYDDNNKNHPESDRRAKRTEEQKE